MRISIRPYIDRYNRFLSQYTDADNFVIMLDGEALSFDENGNCMRAKNIMSASVFSFDEASHMDSVTFNSNCKSVHVVSLRLAIKIICNNLHNMTHEFREFLLDLKYE